MSSASARESILASVRAALPGTPADLAGSHAAVRRNYVHAGSLSPRARRELFMDRLVDYDTHIEEALTSRDIGAAVARVLAQREERRVVVDRAFPAEYLQDTAATRDVDLPILQIEDMQAVLTTCEVAVASTGTIMLLHGAAQGRRVLTLLPDHHICIVRETQIVETIPEAFALPSLRSGAAITTISGPSATSDIEMTRIRGVHGPRQLTVILTP